MMGLFQKLDIWSIMDELDAMIDYDYNGNEKDSPYWEYYNDQIRELAEIAAELYEEWDSIKSYISCQLPYKNSKIDFCEDDYSTMTAIAWFNTAACMLSDIDMKELLENENIYLSDENEEKVKRIRALEHLTKKQQMILYTEVIGFITRFLQLKTAFQVITSVIHELEYHQSFVIKDDKTITPDTAYL